MVAAGAAGAARRLLWGVQSARHNPRMTVVRIEMTDAYKRFGSHVALNGLSLRVEAGEVFGFLGPNGAGKTTAVKVLLGLASLSSGSARLLDRPCGDPQVRARVGFLPEQFRFHEWMTAAEFLDFHGRLYDIPRALRRERIPIALARVGLGARLNARLSTFSKGMLQRAGIAQALLNDPEVVFLDEPTSALDPIGRRDVRDLVRELRNEGVTVFLNSHLLSEVEMICDLVAIVDRGQVVRQGPLGELMGSTLQVEVRAQPMTAALRQALAGFGAVVSAEAERVVLSVASSALVPQIARCVLDHGAQLHGLTSVAPTLEEVFVRSVQSRDT